MASTVHLRRPHGAKFQGVSLLELCVVLAVMLVVAASSLPAMMNILQQYRLRLAARDVAAMLQRSRMRCVRDNRFYTVLEAQTTHGGHIYNQMFLDQNGSAAYDGGEAMVQLPSGVRFNNASAPVLSAATLGYTPQPASTALSFNGLGLPCVVRNGICTNWDSSGNVVGVVYYLQDSRRISVAWAAVTVGPAGRARTWQYLASSSQWQAQ